MACEVVIANAFWVQVQLNSSIFSHMLTVLFLACFPHCSLVVGAKPMRHAARRTSRDDTRRHYEANLPKAPLGHEPPCGALRSDVKRRFEDMRSVNIMSCIYIYDVSIRGHPHFGGFY